MMKSTPFFMSSSRSSREVMYPSPCLLTEVVTMGISSSDTCFANQWLGMRTPRVASQGATSFATHFPFFASMSVRGPGSFSTHSFPFSPTSRHLPIHSLEGAMTENGASFLSLSLLIFLTEEELRALHPMP